MNKAVYSYFTIFKLANIGYSRGFSMNLKKKINIEFRERLLEEFPLDPITNAVDNENAARLRRKDNGTKRMPKNIKYVQ